jgi:uncharacterized membrane protein SirB2
LKWLILIHVLSAIVGVGPTFFGHVLMRRKQTIDGLRQSLSMFSKLEFFPKIGGTIALLSGIVLYFIGDYGSFMQIWLIGSLVLYLYIQIMIIGFAAPAGKKLGTWLFNPDHKSADSLPQEQQKLYDRLNGFYWAASSGGIALFIFMIMKPVL